MGLGNLPSPISFWAYLQNLILFVPYCTYGYYNINIIIMTAIENIQNHINSLSNNDWNPSDLTSRQIIKV